MALLPNEYIYNLLDCVVTEETFSKSVQCLVAQSCLTLCNPMDRSPPGSSVHGILQARILEWVAPSPGDLPDPGIEPASLNVSCIGRRVLYN